VGSIHGCRVIKRKKRVSSSNFHFAKSYNACFPPLGSHVGHVGDVPPNRTGVGGVIIRSNGEVFGRVTGDGSKSVFPADLSVIRPFSVLLNTHRCQGALCRHGYDVIAQNQAILFINCHGNRKRLEPCVFKALHVVKLDLFDSTSRHGSLQDLGILLRGHDSKISEPARDSLVVKAVDTARLA